MCVFDARCRHSVRSAERQTCEARPESQSLCVFLQCKRRQHQCRVWLLTRVIDFRGSLADMKSNLYSGTSIAAPYFAMAK